LKTILDGQAAPQAQESQPRASSRQRESTQGEAKENQDLIRRGLPGVPKSDFIVDPSLLDLNHPIADIEAIRKLNPQRHEMEQLSAILYEDSETCTCAGMKRTSTDDFWARGHMPGMPLMPGVLMLESAAQLASYFTLRHDLLGCEMVGFGGLDEVRFRGVVLPGHTLIVMVKLLKARRGRMIIASFQGVVDGEMVVEGVLRGIPIPTDALNQASV
jgi:3-hydroxyacyl-[acyl-carrier-protein] dehydratase